MNTPNNTNIAPVNFSGMKSVQEPETSSGVIVWFFVVFGLLGCGGLGYAAWLLFFSKAV